MDPGGNGKLFILACDHRRTLMEGMFGIVGRAPNADERARLADAKRLVCEGLLAARESGAPGAAAGFLVDEELGAEAARTAAAAGLLVAMPVEKSGQDTFDFAFGDDFGAHLDAFHPDFAKALVRWNPDDDPARKQRQGERLRRLGEWLRERGGKYICELLVPPSTAQLAQVGGDRAAYDGRLRPAIMRQAIAEIQAAGVEPDLWKIEGLDQPDDCRAVAFLLRRGGRDRVQALVLGRGAPPAQVDRWLRAAAGVPGYAGFAIGRTIWWDVVRQWKDGTLGWGEAVALVAAAYRHFVDVYLEAAG